MVPAETLICTYFIFYFFFFFFFILSLSFFRQRAQVHEPLSTRKKICFSFLYFNHWVQNHCTLIVTYCITSNAEHVATLRASVEYHQLESTKSILMSSERLIYVEMFLACFGFFSVNSLDVQGSFSITLDNIFLQQCPAFVRSVFYTSRY